MNAHYRLKATGTLLIIVLLLAGCAGRRAYNRGTQAELARDYQTAMEQYRLALDENPGNIEYRLKFEQARFAAAFDHFQRGRRAFDLGNMDVALAEFTRTLEIDPSHSLARQEIVRINEVLLMRSRNQQPALTIDQLQQQARTNPYFESQLDVTLTGPITFSSVQESRDIYETLADLAGINVIFDRDFRSVRIPIELRDVDIFEALDILSLQTANFWIPINRSTIIVAQDNTTKRREYETHIIKTIYLNNNVSATEITEIVTMLRQILTFQYLSQNTATNSITLRGPADRVAIAEKLIQDMDLAKPEVVIEAMVLEVDRNQLRELGILPPAGTTLSFLPPGAESVEDGASVSIRDLGLVNSSNFLINIPDTVARFLATSGKTKLLQNPSVRATDNKLASIRIGSRVPVPLGSFQPQFAGATGTPVVQFQYVDVGVNLDITPRVLLNRDISVVVNVQVSALAGDRNLGGVAAPVFTNRQVTHEIRLREGETNILGGIITDTEAVSMTGLPGLKDIPVLKYFFARETRQREETEIIIMLTPHIVRMPDLRAINMMGIDIGTELAPRLRTPGIIPVESINSINGLEGPPAGAGLPPLDANGETNGNEAPAIAGATNAVLSFSPAPVVLGPGGATVDIAIDGSSIFGADLILSFDPAAISIRNVSDGGFLSRDGQIVAVVQRVETETGIARISLERPPGAPPISGQGLLVSLAIEPRNAGAESVIRVTDFRIRDAQQNIYAGTPAEVRVTRP